MTLTDTSLRRRVKRYFNRSTQNLFIPVAPNLEEITYAEAVAILAGDVPASAIAVVPGGIDVAGHVYAVYRLNLWLRTGNRVLLRVGKFWADSLPALFGHARRLPWEVFVGLHPHVHVRMSSSRSRLSTGDALLQSLVDAINSRLTDLRPPIEASPEPTNHSPTIHLRVVNDAVTLSLDTTGNHLYKREYRVDGGAAPIRPTIASALLQFAQAPRAAIIIDPYCGSGTIPIEAALLTAGEPPGRLRHFAFEQLPFHNASMWRRLRAQPPTAATARPSIHGSDLSPDAVAIAQRNVRKARMEGRVQLRIADARDLEPRDLGLQTEVGMLAMNLPYGKRLPTSARPAEFARSTVTALARRFPGWRIALVAPETDVRWASVLSEAAAITTISGGIPIQLVRGQLK